MKKTDVINQIKDLIPVQGYAEIQTENGSYMIEELEEGFQISYNCKNGSTMKTLDDAIGILIMAIENGIGFEAVEDVQ